MSAGSVLTPEEIAVASEAGLPAGWGIECRVFLSRTVSGTTTWQANAWVVWQGGFSALHAWPCTREGLAAAGQWAVEHQAVGSDGYPIRDAGELATLAEDV